MSLPDTLMAQSNYNLASDKNPSIQVSGKSNMHDWKLTSAKMESHGEFKFDSQNNLTTLTSFSFNVAARTLKSGKGIMDTRTYKVMKADAFPKIFYKLTNAIITKNQKNTYTVKSTGELTIAGESRPVTIDLDVVVNADNTITCSGTEKIKLTDFKLTPPTFMLGAMKVYNDLSIQFNLQYKKSNSLTVK